MLEWTMVTKKLVKHWITVNDEGEQTMITVTRVRTSGGVPKGLRLLVDNDITMRDALTKISNVANLDDEMFELMIEHLKY